MSADNCKLCHVATRVQTFSLAAGNARLRFALFQFSCLLIRGTARSILKAQHFIRQGRYGMQGFRTTNAPHFVSGHHRDPR